MKTIIVICLLLSVSVGKVSTRTDSFTGVTTMSTDVLRSAAIYANGSSEKMEYILNLEVSGSTVIYDGVGAFVLFQDGSVWKKEKAPISVTFRSEFKYYCYIDLTIEDMKLFSEKKIDKIKLYVFENSMSEAHSVQFKSEVGEVWVALSKTK